MSYSRRIGVYICHCGLNIAENVDVGEVKSYASKLPNVVIARKHLYMCSEQGQMLIKNDIKNKKLNGIVVASCSPRMHEHTFRSAIVEAGLNKYLFEMANIREHCSWVHNDKIKATEKAKKLVKMAVGKARFLAPLPEARITITPKALVIGGGITGLNSALGIANAGLNVELIEKSAFLGGHIAELSHVSPSNISGINLLEPILNNISKNRKISIHTNTYITKITGYPGNFIIKAKKYSRGVNSACNLCGKCLHVCPVKLKWRKAIYFDNTYPKRYAIDFRHCTKCGKCVNACKQNAIELEKHVSEIELNVGTIIVGTGYDLYKPSEFGYGQNPNIITLMELQKTLKNNKTLERTPSTVVFISCVGSRSLENKYCSRVCCTAIVSTAIELKKLYPEIDIFILYRDMRTYSKYENYYIKARELGIKFVRYISDAPPDVNPENLVVKVYNSILGINLRIPADMVILATAIVPRKDVQNLAEKLKIPRSPDGFFLELHPKLNPVSTPTEGIFIAGAAQSPKDALESISQARAAASKALALMTKGEIVAESITAQPRSEICSKCGLCSKICQYDAIEIDDTGANIAEVSCKGCGVCNVTCFSGVISMKNFEDTQIIAMIKAFGGKNN
jgi:heterodisulfide reductase subunit A